MGGQPQLRGESGGISQMASLRQHGIRGSLEVTASPHACGVVWCYGACMLVRPCPTDPEAARVGPGATDITAGPDGGATRRAAGIGGAHRYAGGAAVAAGPSWETW